MGKYNEEPVKAGVMLAGEGLQAGAKGARVKFAAAGTDDFGANLTAELRQQEDRPWAQTDAKSAARSPQRGTSYRPPVGYGASFTLSSGRFESRFPST